MTAKESIGWLLKANQAMVKKYLSDLSDADLLVRPVPSANHIAWQLGHLINAEAEFFGRKILGSNAPKLPAGFAEKHGKENHQAENGFLSKDEYIKHFDATRAATLARLNELTDADLDKPSGWNQMAPTIGSVFSMVANHDMMHAGQFTVVRRKLGKPVWF